VLHPHFLSICLASEYMFRLCGVPVSVLSSFHTPHHLLSVYTRQRDSVCVKVALLSRVIIAACRAIIPLSSVVAGLLERYMFVYCLVSLRLEWESLGGTIKMALHYYEVLYRGVILYVIHIMTRPAIDHSLLGRTVTLARPLSPSVQNLANTRLRNLWVYSTRSHHDLSCCLPVMADSSSTPHIRSNS
jgi:hypothetical protein